MPAGDIECEGCGAVVARPDGISQQQWEQIAQAHGRLMAIATGAIDLEPGFFQGAGPGTGMESISLQKVTHCKWRTSVGTWVPQGMAPGSQQASFAILLTQQKLQGDQHAVHRDIILQKFSKEGAKTLFEDMAAVLRCHATFASHDALIANDTMPKEELDKGVTVFEAAGRTLAADCP